MNEVLIKAISHYGSEHQIDKAIEEMSELIKALLKYRYCVRQYEKDIVKESVDEEMADVEIMMEQLRMIFNNAREVETVKAEKIERLERQIRRES